MYTLHASHQETQREPGKAQIVVNREVGTETPWLDPRTLMVSDTFMSEVIYPPFMENLE